MMSKKKKVKVQEEATQINYKTYMIRFAVIYFVNITALLALIYQADLKDGWIFAIFMIGLTAKFTNNKFIIDHKRIYTKDEKFKFIWSSWSIVWFISIITTVPLSYYLGGQEALANLMSMFATMSTWMFLLSIGEGCIVTFAILYLMYSWQPQKEFDALKRSKKF